MISVLLLSWNTKDLTLRCLASLGSAAVDLELETIVVDNASHDGSAEALAALSGITLIRNQENRGYAPAVNQAFAASHGELVLLLNSDVELEPGSIKVLAEFLEAHPEAAGVGPLYLNPDRTEQDEHSRLPTFLGVLGNVSSVAGRLPPVQRRVRGYKMLDDDFSKPRSVEQPAASCLLLRRSKLDPQHLLDERFPIYFNDVELARSLKARGETLWMTPASIVVHEKGASTRLLGGALARHYVGSLILYLRQTEPVWKLELLRTVLLLEYTARRIVGHKGALPFSELVPALRGDPGPIPQISKPGD